MSISQKPLEAHPQVSFIDQERFSSQIDCQTKQFSGTSRHRILLAYSATPSSASTRGRLAYFSSYTLRTYSCGPRGR